MRWPELQDLLKSLREERATGESKKHEEGTGKRRSHGHECALSHDNQSFTLTIHGSKNNKRMEGGERGGMSGLLRNLNDQREDERTGREPTFDLKRCQIISRLYELLSGQCNPRIGVLQSDVCNVFTKTHFHSASVFFYTMDEIDEGCVTGPSLPLFTISSDAYNDALDDRLCVTEEIFEQMLTEMTNLDLAQVLDAYTDYVHVTETSWQVSTVERTEFDRDAGMIRNASGLATHDRYAYVTDSCVHVIFRVNIFTEQVELFVGRLNCPGFHDGPREMALFNCPSGICLCKRTQTLYVADTKNNSIRAVGLSSGVVQTLGLASVDYIDLQAPVGVCVVYADYEYDEDENDSDEEETKAQDDTDGVEEPDAYRLDGIAEEEDDHSNDDEFGMGLMADFEMPNLMEGGDKGTEWLNEVVARRRLTEMRLRSARFSLADDSGISRNSSVRTSRRTTGIVTAGSSVNTTRRTSLSWASTSAIESLRECTEDLGYGLNLAVACDHSVFLVKPQKNEMKLLAGSLSEYGYKDSVKGADARFSSLKGLTCIRNSIFVADHWNNVIRCINLKTTQVDTVVDFEPNGPMALTVSGSGNLYVLDSETIQYCNVLRICSIHMDKPTEGVLGTLSFRALQKQIAETRSGFSSVASSRRSSIASDVGGPVPTRRRSSTEMRSRRASGEAGHRRESGSRNSLSVKPQDMFQRGSINDLGRGSINDLGRGSISDLRGGGEQRDLQSLSSKQSSHDSRLNALGAPSSQAQGNSKISEPHSTAPEIPAALRTLIPGASLHPALFRMASRNSRRESFDNQRPSVGQYYGSQFRVSVASSGSADDEEADVQQFQSHMTPKQKSPWTTIPIYSLQYIFQESSGQYYPNTPLSLAFWDHADMEHNSNHRDTPWRQMNVLLVGLIEWPWLLKVNPPIKPPPADAGRFRAVSVDLRRLLVADQESNQIFAINHTKNTKDKVAGCGKEGWLDGPLDICRMNRPSSICLDPTTHFIYVADKGNHRIRCIDLSTGFMSTVCGNGAKGCQDSTNIQYQSLDSPFELEFTPPHHLLICCADNSVRKFDIRMCSLETVLIGS